MASVEKKLDETESFEQMRDSWLNFDPVYWVQKKLTIDGEPIDLSGGWKPFADIYRYVGIQAMARTDKDTHSSLPMILLKSRQTGGTVMAAAMSLYLTDNYGSDHGTNTMRIIHAFPVKGMAESYSKTQFSPMCSNSILVDFYDGKSKDEEQKPYIKTKLDEVNCSASYKIFKNGNHIWIESTGLTGDRLRGKTADVIFYDEVQDITGTAIANSNKILTQSKYGRVSQGVQIYFGTPKRKGSTFYDMWEASSQQFFYLGCENCKELFPLYVYGEDCWETTWITGFIVQCRHCGHKQDKREAAARGKWVSSAIPGKKIDYVGFHINMLFMPLFTKEDVLKEKPENNVNSTERAFRNERLGEFFNGDSSTLTIEEIRQSCGDYERAFYKRIPVHDKLVIMGIDYGQMNDQDKLIDPKRFGGESNTVAVILIEEQPGLFFIAYACKFPSNDPKDKHDMIDLLMRTYNVDLCIGDLGFSFDFSQDVRKKYNDKYITSNALPRLNDRIRYDELKTPPCIPFDKDYYYNEMLDQLRKGAVRFPLKNYDSIEWLMEHCSNLELKPFLSHGIAVKRYVKKGKTDGFAALLNAYIGYKYIVTNGFKDMTLLNSRDELQKEKEHPQVLSAYIPFRK